MLRTQEVLREPFHAGLTTEPSGQETEAKKKKKKKREREKKKSSDYENIRLQRDGMTLDALADGCTLARLTRQH